MPYGEGEEQLGTILGYEGITFGPEFGARAPDRTWWLMDTYKDRLAHFDARGNYLDSVAVPPDLLPPLSALQFPRVLADGMVVLAVPHPTSPRLVTLVDGDLTVLWGVGVTAVADDGELVYGWDEWNEPGSADPITGELQPVDAFLTQSGRPYRIEIDRGEDGDSISIALPDVGVSRSVELTSTVPGQVRASFAVATGADGTVHLLLSGYAVPDDSDEGIVGLAGYTWVEPDGDLGPMEPMIDPFRDLAAADFEGGSYLGVTYGSRRPWMVFEGASGAEVYARSRRSHHR